MSSNARMNLVSSVNRLRQSHTAWHCASTTSSLFLLCVFAWSSWTVCSQASAADDPNAAQGVQESSLHRRIAALIEMLGDANYSNRLSAQAELDSIGVLALDQLHLASSHPDPQIAASARYIVQSNQFTWAWETDPTNVRQILTNYRSAQPSEKHSFIDQLNRLEHDQGLPALCRLVRYETQSSLAKWASLLLLRGKSVIGQSMAERKAIMLTHIQGGQSRASSWLLQFANQKETFDLPWWEQTLKQELELLEKGSAETSLEIVTDLHRWVVEQIYDNPKLRDRALQIARTIPTLSRKVPTLDSMLGNQSTHANEYAQWALKFRFPELVQEQHARLPYSVTSREFLFGYLLAESYQLQQNEALAQSIAKRSRENVAVDEKGEPAKPKQNQDGFKLPIEGLSINRGVTDQDRRQVIARRLQERGHFDWAEEEYKLAIDNDLTNGNTLMVMISLGDMLHSQGRYQDAAKVLEPFVTRYNNEPLFQRQVIEWSGLPDRLLSNYYIYLADDQREKKEFDKAKTNYWKSIERSPDNVDAIIGLYGMEASGSEADKRQAKLKEVVSALRAEIREQETYLRKANSLEHSFFQSQLANTCNTLAWVVAKTEGNKSESLYLSRKANALSPEHAEYLDTLAHCFATLGKYQDAVEQQRRAVELKPHHPDLKKALVEFESKLKSEGSREPDKESPK